MRGVSQGDLAAALNVTVQAVSKWETGKSNPDLYLLPKLATYFLTSIDALFANPDSEQPIPAEAVEQLETNSQGWTEVTEMGWSGTILPAYGPYTPSEDDLHLMGDVCGKSVLEITCGDGASLVWMAEHGAKELWGLDISARQIELAGKRLKEAGADGRLFVSPMETDPGLPHRYFDLVYSVYGLGWTLDLEKTVKRIGEYLRPGGSFIFSWDNPMMQCVDAVDGNYILTHSYAKDREVDIQKKGSRLHLKNWKLSSYLNTLIDHGFVIERIVEESVYDLEEAQVFRERKYYSAGLAKLINPVIVVKARKM